MPRQNRRRGADEAAPRAGGQNPGPGGYGGGLSERTEPWRGVDYTVRSITGSAATKDYRCPGCDQEVRAGVPHLVAWPSHDTDATDRRHWHSPCWSARARRAPGVLRGRSAPRH